MLLGRVMCFGDPRERRRLDLLLTVAVVLAQTVGAYLFGSGLDFALFRQATLSQHPSVWLPAYGYWLLWPVMLLPARVAFAALVLVSSGLMAYAGHRLTGSGLPALLCSAGFLSADTGQIDGLIAAGMALGVLACERRKPHLLGVALLFMSLKPQLSLVAALWMMLYLRNWRTLVIPAGVILLSLVTDGLWPLELLASPPQVVLTAQNISPWRITGPLLLPLVSLPFLAGRRNPRRALALAVASSALAMPYFNLFSLDVLFAAGVSPWLVPLTYLPFLPWPPSWNAWRGLALAVVPALGLALLLRQQRPKKWWPLKQLRGGWVALLVALLAAFALRVVHLQGRALWYDEAFAVLYAARSPAEMLYGTVTPVTGAGAADVHPLLYYFLLHGWMTLAGQSSYAVRFLSAAMGVVTVALLGRVAGWCFDRRVGLAVALLAAVNPFHIAYSQETRMYALLGLAAVATAWGLTRALDGWAPSRQSDRSGLSPGRSPAGSARWWALYAIAAAVTLYAHNLGAFFLLALHLLVVARRRWRRQLLRLALADLLALVLFSPWLVGVLPGQLGFVRKGYWLARPGAIEIARTVLLPILTFYEPAPPWLLGLGLFTGLLLLALVALRTWRARSSAGWFLVLCWAPILSLFLVSQWRPIYLERALLPSALLYLVAVGWLLVRGKLPRLLRLGLVLLLAMSTAGSLGVHYTYARFPRPPFQQAAAFLRDHVEPTDAVVHTNKLTYFPMVAYDPELPGVFLADPPGSPQDTLARPTQEALGIYATRSITVAVGDAQRVWLVYFPREVEEVRALGIEHPALLWMEGRFVPLAHTQFQDLMVAQYRVKES